MTDDRIECLRGQPPGEDEKVYTDSELEALPDWWRRSVEEHKSYGLRPYRPPRFEDGVLTTPYLETLEDRYGVDIQLIGIDSSYGDDWTVLVENEPAFDIARRRDPSGYTVLERSSEGFAEAVESVLDESQ